MIVATVAPLGRRSRPSTRACFEFARLLCSPLRRALGRTLDEACAFAVRPRLRLDMPKLLSIVPAATLRRHHQSPTEATGRWRGRGSSRSGSLSVTTTDALFAGKVQRKVSNGVVDWPQPHHRWIGRNYASVSSRRKSACCDPGLDPSCVSLAPQLKREQSL
jgi:hypothetical protein